MSVKCTVCDKTVYDQERQSYDNRHWHQACFKCLSCKRRIDVKSVAMIKGDLYCKPCFLKVFKEKGSYASFGVKTLPNWKPGGADGGVGPDEHTPTPSTPPADTTSEAKAVDSAPAAVPKAAVAASPPVAESVPVGINYSSSDLPNPKCKVCTKTVYDQEKQVYDKTVWHIACFKCLSCKRRIDVKAVAMIQGDLYCKACFLKVFKEKGSYASFGPKTLPKWQAATAGGDGGVGSDSPTTPPTPATPDDAGSPVPSTIAESASETPAVETS